MPSWIWFFDLVSVTNEGVLVKFGANTDIAYSSVAKITLFVKLKIVAILTKFGTPILNEMPMIIRK